MRHRLPRLPAVRLWTVIAADDVGVLAGHVEMAIRAERDVEGVGQTRVRLVLLGKDLSEGVLPLRPRFPGEAEHLGRILVSVGDEKISVRPERESSQLAQLQII